MLPYRSLQCCLDVLALKSGRGDVETNLGLKNFSGIFYNGICDGFNNTAFLKANSPLHNLSWEQISWQNLRLSFDDFSTFVGNGGSRRLVVMRS